MAPKEPMNNRFDIHAKGIISLAVILMFTVALIAGQARANLPAKASADSDYAHAALMQITLDTQTLSTIHALPHLVDTILALPIDVELSMNGLSLRNDGGEEAGAGDSPVQ